MRKGVFIIPNSITLCAMFAGFYAIIMSLKGHYVNAAWGIIVAAVFDGLDGTVARMTNSTTKFGIEFDSLSDVVAFGVAPAVMGYSWALTPFGRVGWAVAFFLPHAGP
jgi:CDP-diacylglycerol--serine O-phosphatidyltransferase